MRDMGRRHGAGATRRGRGGGGAASVGLLALALLAPDSAGAQFTVSPGSVRFEAADSAASAVVYVRNEGKQDLQFRFYLGDFTQKESGDYDFLAPGSTPQSCAGRLSVFPDGAVLRPGAQEAVRLRMDGGSSVCWGMLFVETAPEGNGPVRISKRVATKVFAVPAGRSPEAEIASVVVAGAAPRRNAEVEFRNLGEVPVYASGQVEVRALDGSVLDRVPVERFSVLPKHARRLSIPLPAALPAGRYLAVPVLDFGAEYVAGGQALFTVQ